MRVLSGAVLALLVAGAGPAMAQDRDGFFVGFGGGWGSAKIDCDLCDEVSERESSGTGQIRLGTTLSERLSVGLEGNGWLDEQDGDSVTFINATAALYFYPTDAGIFLKGGVGLARADFDIEGETLSGMGLGLMAGAGYDFRIGDTTALTPTITFWHGKPGDLELDGIPVLSGFSYNVIEAGVQITFY